MKAKASGSKVLSFGEVLLRMSPQPAGGWLEESQMPVYVGGAEINVAAALARWGVEAKVLTALPENYLGDDIIAYLKGCGLDTSAIRRTGSRVGIYYLQQGTDMKHGGVVYDRMHSSFSELRAGTIDWDEVLKDVEWFSFSAITPALNEHMPALCKEALEAARRKELTISVDLNYRAKLWQWGAQPIEVMPELVQHCDVVMGNIWSASTLLGVPLEQGIEKAQTKDAYLRHAAQTSAAIMQKFPRCKVVANTFRFEKSAGALEYLSTLFTDGRLYTSPHFATDDVVDKVGSGDCFMAGLIYGLHHKHTPQDTVDFAAAAAVGKLGERGDSTAQTVGQVRQVLGGGVR